MGRLQGGVTQAGGFANGRKDSRSARMNSPGTYSSQVQPMVGQPGFQPRSQVLADQVGNPWRKGHLESLVTNSPGHRVLRGPITVEPEATTWY